LGKEKSAMQDKTPPHHGKGLTRKHKKKAKKDKTPPHGGKDPGARRKV
jgi:hypothetical protein